MTNNQDALNRALNEIQNQNYSDAMSIFQGILDNQPEEPILYEVLTHIGFLYHANEQYEDSIQILTEAVQLPFTDHHGQINKCLGIAYQAKGENEIASEYFIESLLYLDDQQLESAIIKYELGKLLLDLNDLELSYVYLKEAEQFFKVHEPKYYHSTLYYLGFNSFMKEEIELAESYFNVLLLSKDIQTNELVHGYFGMLHVANYRKDADEIFKNASLILENDADFYDKETLTYMTVKAYSYQKREQEYFAALDLFMNDYPDGKYSDEYTKLKDESFQSVKK